MVPGSVVRSFGVLWCSEDLKGDRMKLKIALLSLLLACALGADSRAASKGPAGGGERSDFALFDGTNPAAIEFGAQCGAKLGSSGQAVAFTYYVNVSDLSDTLKVRRVLYADG